MKKFLIAVLTVALVTAGVAAVSAYEAWIVNVTAHVENALFVHPESRNFGVMFPQEYKEMGLFVTFSQSFSETDQTRVSNIDYKIVQKPKPRPEYIAQVGLDSARKWCHDNVNDSDFLNNCYPILCPWLSKTPDNQPFPGNDVGVPAFHDPFDPNNTAKGTINKNGVDVGDNWTIDLATPCFKGECSQDWADFVHRFNPAADPNQFMAPAGLGGGADFGCDLWVEVTKIY